MTICIEQYQKIITLLLITIHKTKTKTKNINRQYHDSTKDNTTFYIFIYIILLNALLIPFAVIKHSKNYDNLQNYKTCTHIALPKNYEINVHFSDCLKKHFY